MELVKFDTFANSWMTYLKVLVEADDAGWGESQRQEVRERKPEPELGEDQNTND